LTNFEPILASDPTIAQIASSQLEKLQPQQVPPNIPNYTGLSPIMTQTMHLSGDPPARHHTGVGIKTGLPNTINILGSRNYTDCLMKAFTEKIFGSLKN
jgi:hypothetical protein